MMKSEIKRKRWKRVLIILGAFLLLLIVLGGAGFLYLRHNMGMVRVSIGAPDDRTIVSTATGQVRGYMTDSLLFRNGGDAALQNAVSQAWVCFARDGAPSADALPEWEPYTLEGGATMILDTQSYLAHHHDAELLELLDPGYVYWD